MTRAVLHFPARDRDVVQHLKERRYHFYERFGRYPNRLTVAPDIELELRTEVAKQTQRNDIEGVRLTKFMGCALTIDKIRAPRGVVFE